MLLQLVALQVITFIAIAVLLKILFSRHLNSALKRLKTLQDEAMLRENQLKEELDGAKKDRLEEIEKGKKEAKALIDQAKKEVEAIRTGAEDDARQQGKNIFAHGQEELEKIKAKMESDMEGRSLQLAVDLISYTFSHKGKEDLQRQFIAELIDEIADLEKNKFSVKTNKAHILTSFPLTDKEKEKLKKVLSEKMGLAVTITEKITPELITGLIIQLDALEIDGSLKNRLRKALPLLKKQ
ncbi:MAG: F0F1 ATP synthase subunit delta [Candidatus Omnitrophota bacterium]|nr:F0F1 ATP synthase subunit delta [Candidatus Omnitrophota bacterium]